MAVESQLMLLAVLPAEPYAVGLYRISLGVRKDDPKPGAIVTEV